MILLYSNLRNCRRMDDEELGGSAVLGLRSSTMHELLATDLAVDQNFPYTSDR